MSPVMPSSGKLEITPRTFCCTFVSAVLLFQHRTADHHGEPALHVDGPSLWVREVSHALYRYAQGRRRGTHWRTRGNNCRHRTVVVDVAWRK